MTFQKNLVAAKLFAKLMSIVLWLQTIATKLTPPHFRNPVTLCAATQ